MNKSSSPIIFSSLILAGGILAGTALSAALAGSGWWVLAGPLLLAVSLVAAYAVAQDVLVESRKYAVLILGGSFLVAASIVALQDPAQVASLVPIMGSCGVFVLLPGERVCE